MGLEAIASIVIVGLIVIIYLLFNILKVLCSIGIRLEETNPTDEEREDRAEADFYSR